MLPAGKQTRSRNSLPFARMAFSSFSWRISFLLLERKSAICHFQYRASQNCHSQHWLRKNATHFVCTLITMPFFLFSLLLFLFSIFWHMKGPKYPCSYLYFGIRSALEADECVLPAVNTVLAASLVARTSWVNRWTLPPSPGSRRR